MGEVGGEDGRIESEWIETIAKTDNCESSFYPLHMRFRLQRPNSTHCINATEPQLV
jgi:hypothetical protein